MKEKHEKERGQRDVKQNIRKKRGREGKKAWDSATVKCGKKKLEKREAKKSAPCVVIGSLVHGSLSQRSDIYIYIHIYTLSYKCLDSLHHIQ